MAWPPERMRAARDIVLGSHPKAQVRSLSSVYNCMGMVFASRRTCVEPDHLRMILQDDEYQRVNNEGQLQPGDVIIYRDDENQVSHVGVVVEVKPNLEKADREILVLSQWGGDGEYLHLNEDVNPRLGKPAEYWTDRI